MTDFERRVYWDGYGIGPKPSGIAVYASNLQSAIERLGVYPQIIDANFAPGFLFSSSLWQSKPLHPIRSIFALRKKLKLESPPSLPVIFHGLSNLNLPLFFAAQKDIRSVLTVHDLIPFFAKDSVSAAYYQQFSYLLPKAVRKADRVVCVSEWTRQTLLERYPDIKDKTSVILNGSDGLSGKSGDLVLPPQPDVKNSFRILTVGRPEVYKRHGHFIELLRRSKGLFSGTIVTTERGYAQLTRLASDLIAKGSLKILFDVPNEQLTTIYADHDVYVHPSLYEGFCLPAAEALSVGIPVVFQKGSAVDEVVSPGCGFGLNRQDSFSDWIDAIKKMGEIRESTEFRIALTKHHAEKPTWKDTAAHLKKLYTYLLEN